MCDRENVKLRLTQAIIQQLLPDSIFLSLPSDCEFLAKIVQNVKKADVFTQKWNMHFKLSSIVGHELSFVE